MLSFLNSSTLDSDDEKEKSSIVPKSDLDLYPPNLDENQLLEIEKLTADSLIDLINNVQKVWFPWARLKSLSVARIEPWRPREYSMYQIRRLETLSKGPTIVWLGDSSADNRGDYLRSYLIWVINTKIKLPREVQDPEAVKTLHQSGKLEPLLNVIEFGSEGVSYLIGQPISPILCFFGPVWKEPIRV